MKAYNLQSMQAPVSGSPPLNEVQLMLLASSSRFLEKIQNIGFVRHFEQKSLTGLSAMKFFQNTKKNLLSEGL